MENMTMEMIQASEKANTGTSWTRNEEFDKNGYLVIKDLWDSEELYREVPEERGMINYWGKKTDQFNHIPVESQVEGSLATYTHPQYLLIHNEIRLKLEKVIGRKLYGTYYYDRYYFPGQDLKIHTDRDACEISVSVHISSNTKEPWKLWIKTPDEYTDEKKTEVKTKGEDRYCLLEPGDGMVYKGCERPHWREPLPSNKSVMDTEGEDDTYYHQIFFHYVLQDGQRAHCAWDRAR